MECACHKREYSEVGISKMINQNKELDYHIYFMAIPFDNPRLKLVPVGHGHCLTIPSFHPRPQV